MLERERLKPLHVLLLCAWAGGAGAVGDVWWRECAGGAPSKPVCDDLLRAVLGTGACETLDANEDCQRAVPACCSPGAPGCPACTDALRGVLNTANVCNHPENGKASSCLTARALCCPGSEGCPAGSGVKEEACPPDGIPERLPKDPVSGAACAEEFRAQKDALYGEHGVLTNQDPKKIAELDLAWLKASKAWRECREANPIPKPCHGTNIAATSNTCGDVEKMYSINVEPDRLRKLETVCPNKYVGDKQCQFDATVGQCIESTFACIPPSSATTTITTL